MKTSNFDKAAVFQKGQNVEKPIFSKSISGKLSQYSNFFEQFEDKILEGNR